MKLTISSLTALATIGVSSIYACFNPTSTQACGGGSDVWENKACYHITYSLVNGIDITVTWVDCPYTETIGMLGSCVVGTAGNDCEGPTDAKCKYQMVFTSACCNGTTPATINLETPSVKYAVANICGG